MTKKVTSLKREIKERLEIKHITDFTDMKLKKIDLTARWPKQESQLNSRITKVGKTLLEPILKEDISDEEKIRKIESIVNIGDFSLKLEILSKDGDEKKLLDVVSQNKARNDTILRVTVTDGIKESYSFSWLNHNLPRSKNSFWKIRYSSAEHQPVSNLRTIIGIVFIANSINKYYKNNKEMAQISLLNLISHHGVFRSEDELNRINALRKSHNLPKSTSNKPYFRDIEIPHIGWLENNEYLTFDYIYRNHKDKAVIFELINEGVIIYFLNFLIELNNEEEDEVKMERSLASDYAKSFQTKKNIPEKILEKMNDNKFLSNFGYVEFDELTDLSKISLVEDEWEEINKKINFPIAKDHSFRVRRLGNHNAAGLYFPTAKTVCIDINSPSSMIHEVFHMIDYSNKVNQETLSSRPNFRGIIEVYREVTDNLVDKLPDGDSFKESWKGNTKYNKTYFHNSKEIFARCGEIYIKHILKIDNSLVNASNELLYPRDERLLDLISNYYKDVIKENKREEYTFNPNSEKYLTKEMVANVLKNGQLSMFN